jgi:hypothetical protein
MVSLLVKLYSKLMSGAHYRPNFDEIPTSRVGDGGYFTSHLLNKLGHHDSATRAHILQVVIKGRKNTISKLTCGGKRLNKHDFVGIVFIKLLPSKIELQFKCI